MDTALYEKKIILPERGLGKTQSSPEDILIDWLAVNDKNIFSENGIPIRVSRMAYIADFITNNMVTEYEDENEDGTIVTKKRLNKDNAKLFIELLKLGNKKEVADKNSDRIDHILQAIEARRSNENI